MSRKTQEPIASSSDEVVHCINNKVIVFALRNDRRPGDKVKVFPKENHNFLDRRRERISAHISGVCIVSIKYNVGGADNRVDGTDDEVDEADDRSR